MTESRVIPGGTPKFVVNKTANSSDKSFTVPTGKRWDVLSVVCQIQCTATVGNRILAQTYTDGTDPISNPLLTGIITASQFGIVRMYTGAPVAPFTTAPSRLDGSAIVNVAYTMGIGRMVLAAGSVIRCYDTAAIDAAADDLIVVLHYIEYDA